MLVPLQCMTSVHSPHPPLCVSPLLLVLQVKELAHNVGTHGDVISSSERAAKGQVRFYRLAS